MQSRRLVRLGIIGLFCLVLLCAGTIAVVRATTPPNFRSHRDTIAYALEMRRIAFADIQFRQSFEENNNLLFYQAGVQVMRPDGSIIHGWIGCENGDNQCFLDLRGLDIHGLPLPDLTPAASMPGWFVWAERTLREIDLRTPMFSPTPTPVLPPFPHPNPSPTPGRGASQRSTMPKPCSPTWEKGRG